MPEDRITRANIADHISAQTGLTAEQVKAVLRSQAELAYTHAENGFPIPGIGTLRIIKRPERKAMTPPGPQGQRQITIPAKSKVDFRVSRAAKEIILGPPQPLPDLFAASVVSEIQFSTSATQLSELPNIVQNFSHPITLKAGSEAASLVAYQLPNLRLPTGRIRAADPFIGGGSEPLTREVAPGSYPLFLVGAKIAGHVTIALAILRFSEQRVATWEVAMQRPQPILGGRTSVGPGYPVDSGMGSFADIAVVPLLEDAEEEDPAFMDRFVKEMHAPSETKTRWFNLETPHGSLAAFSSGGGDGRYISYFGLDDANQPSMLVTDFAILNWRP